MKKIIITVLSAVLLICLFPMSASAAEVLEEPVVQYKLINHDEIALRWTEVEGADGYCVYRTDVETGKTVKYKEIVKDTTFNATGLEPATDYIFKVAAVSENDGQIAFGKKSKGTALTTPDEWYYYFPNHMYLDEDDDDTELDFMMRKHYDNTGEEVFNMADINKKIHNKVSHIYDDMSVYYNISNIDGYIYFVFWYSLDEHSTSMLLCRMKNDGSDFEIVTYLCNDYDEKYYIFTDQKNSIQYIYEIANENANTFGGDAYSNEFALECFDDYKTNYIETRPDGYDYDAWEIYEDINNGLTSAINSYYYDRYNKFHEKDQWYEENNVSFSGFARDDKYIYFFSEPLYNITDKSDTIVYRAKYDGSDLQKIITIPKDNSLIYGDPNNGSIQLFDCDGEYLYYYVYGKKASEINRNFYYTFYRININEKDAVSQKITSVDSSYGVDVELCNGYLYIETYIYDKNYDAVPIYIRIRADGKGLEKQDEPFEWRY